MTLTVVGDGPLRTSLEELCQQLDVSGSVRFLGQLPNEEVFVRLCESTFFVMVSKPEGFGIVYLEAMAAGLGIHNGYICACMDARRNQVYNAIFLAEKGVLTRITEDRAIALADLKKSATQKHMLIFVREMHFCSRTT